MSSTRGRLFIHDCPCPSSSFRCTSNDLFLFCLCVRDKFFCLVDRWLDNLSKEIGAASHWQWQQQEGSGGGSKSGTKASSGSGGGRYAPSSSSSLSAVGPMPAWLSPAVEAKLTTNGVTAGGAAAVGSSGKIAATTVAVSVFGSVRNPNITNNNNNTCDVGGASSSVEALLKLI